MLQYLLVNLQSLCLGHVLKQKDCLITGDKIAHAIDTICENGVLENGALQILRFYVCVQ